MEYFWVNVSDEDFGRGVRIAPLNKAELADNAPVVRKVKLSEGFETSVLYDYIKIRAAKGHYHLISDRLKNLCAVYDKCQEWRPIALIDQHERCHVYWFWDVRTIDCLSDKTIYNFDGTVKALAINTEGLRYEHNFIVPSKSEKLIVIRLDFAESALRRGFIGFKLRRVLTSGE
jgi:hypothetical protein